MTARDEPISPSSGTNPNSPIASGAVRCTEGCPFDVRVSVQPSTLTPLAIEEFDYDGWKEWVGSTDILPFKPGAGTPGQEEIKFDVVVLQSDVDELYLEIVDMASRYGPEGKTCKKWQLTEDQSNGLKEGTGAVSPGARTWIWDGYINDILSTKFLKKDTLAVRTTVVRGGRFKDNLAPLNGKHFSTCVPIDWVDVIVYRKTKRVKVEWRIAFDYGGVSGGDPTEDTPDFNQLLDMASRGIRYHWSRLGSFHIDSPKGEYAVLVKPIWVSVHQEPRATERKTDNYTPSLTLTVSVEENSHRSSNASCACGTGWAKSRIEQYLDMTIVWYEEGYFRAIKKTHEEFVKTANADFKATAAHEIGHAVLATYAYRDDTNADNYSWIHKGSSTGAFDRYGQPGPNEKGFEKEPDPMPAEMDLMKYYLFGVPFEIQRASEYDTMALIWASRVSFGK